MSKPLQFTKMNGAGNDFVLLDNRDQTLELSREQIARLCDRHRGIGADGLLAVEPAQGGADYRMRYYNADGGEAEMCGNGARCFARFVNQLEHGKLDALTFETMAGVISASFIGDQVQISLSEPKNLLLEQHLIVGGPSLVVHSVNTGVPHAVVFVDDLEGAEVVRVGRLLRQHEAFAPAGTNANFVQILGPGEIAIRTYERGVEDETLACGTGMVACAIVHAELSGDGFPIKVHVRGGDVLSVSMAAPNEDALQPTLTGPADFVFSGQLTLTSL